MDIQFIVLLVVICIAAICGMIITYNIAYRKDKNIKVADNHLLLEQRQSLKKQIKDLLENLNALNNEYDTKRKLIQLSWEDIEKSNALEIQRLEQHYQQQEEELQQQQKGLQEKIKTAKSELQSLKATKAATIAAFQKEKIIQESVDSYRLDISIQDIQDVSFLRSIQFRISKPRLVSMLIWQNYYQPIAKKKLPSIVGSQTICGIYKITSIKTQMCYIGQSVDIRKRLLEHMKKGLGIDTPQNNKLYKAMLDEGLENFTFEVIEECGKDELNNKEQYYIELYNSIEWGYNSRKQV